MSNQPWGSQYCTQIDVIHSLPATKRSATEPLEEISMLLREMLSAQGQQNRLLGELVSQITHLHRRRNYELGLWKQANPELAEFCRRAAIQLERVQTDLLSTITEEIDDNADDLLDSEYVLGEFVDRFGSKFMHLNGLLQVLTQLGNAPDLQFQPAETPHDA